jgi:hypothetical protein
MTEPFDPYYQWLDIPAAERPPNHYRLLGISLFESDDEVIEAAADRQMSRLGDHQSDRHNEISQKLLGEIASARRCLLDPESKANYDAELRGAPHPSAPSEDVVPSRRPAPPVFVARKSPESPQAEPAPTAPPVPPRRRRAYNGLLMWTISIVTVICAFILVTQSFTRREATRKGPAPVQLPADADQSLAGKTVIVPDNVIVQGEDGDVVLPVSQASVDANLPPDSAVLAWDGQLRQVRWNLLVSRPGFFMVEVTYAADQSAAGNSFEISVADRRFEFRARDTGSHEAFLTDETKMVLFRRGGRYELTMRPLNVHSDPIIHLKAVRLRRTSAK